MTTPAELLPLLSLSAEPMVAFAAAGDRWRVTAANGPALRLLAVPDTPALEAVLATLAEQSLGRALRSALEAAAEGASAEWPATLV
ncbi:MAG: hypothetical protein KC613_14115, partial [Myxococcales bacterium]|nr:hypothetical protein [Myxococcales bacterium]